MNTTKTLAFMILALLLSGCTPEVGSDAWCQKMDEKQKSDWTTREATDYAKHCFLDKFD